VETWFTWDQAAARPQVVATSGGQTAQYLYGLELSGVRQGGQGYSPLADALGSLRQWTDAAGAVVGSASYDPFGGVLAQQGFTSPWGFAGEYHDPLTGLQYLRARWYQPGVGRFTQVDPFPGIQTLPLTQNPYVYAGNNPVRYTDPSGRIVEEILGSALLGGALSAVGEIYAEGFNFAQSHPGITWEQFWGCLGSGAVLNGGMIAGAFVNGFTATLLYELISLSIMPHVEALGVFGLLWRGFAAGAFTSIIGDIAGRNVELWINGQLPASKDLWKVETYKIDFLFGGAVGAVGMVFKAWSQVMKNRTMAYQAELNRLEANPPTWRGTKATAMSLGDCHDLSMHGNVAERKTIRGFKYALTNVANNLQKSLNYAQIIDGVSALPFNSNFWYSLYDAIQP